MLQPAWASVLTCLGIGRGPGRRAAARADSRGRRDRDPGLVPARRCGPGRPLGLIPVSPHRLQRRATAAAHPRRSQPRFRSRRGLPALAVSCARTSPWTIVPGARFAPPGSVPPRAWPSIAPMRPRRPSSPRPISTSRCWMGSRPISARGSDSVHDRIGATERFSASPDGLPVVFHAPGRRLERHASPSPP